MQEGTDLLLALSSLVLSLLIATPAMADDEPTTQQHFVGSKGFSIVLPATWERSDREPMIPGRKQEFFVGPAGPGGRRPQLMVEERDQKCGTLAELVDATKTYREFLEDKGCRFEGEPAEVFEGARIRVVDRFSKGDGEDSTAYVSMLTALDSHTYHVQGWGAASDDDLVPTIVQALASFRPDANDDRWSYANRLEPAWVPVGKGTDAAVLRFDVRGAFFERDDEDAGAYRAIDGSERFSVSGEEASHDCDAIVKEWLQFWEGKGVEKTIESQERIQLAGRPALRMTLRDEFRSYVLVAIEVSGSVGASVFYRLSFQDEDTRDLDLLLASLRIQTPEEATEEQKARREARSKPATGSAESRPR